MPCPHCCSAQTTERSDRTAHGYRRFRCRGCGRGFNERTGSVLNRLQLPTDGFRQVSRQILSGGTDQPWRAVSSSGDGEHIAQGGDPLDIDRPSTRCGHVLLAPGGWSEEVAHFVVGQAEAGGAGVSLEAPHRPEAPFYSPVILFQMVV